MPGGPEENLGEQSRPLEMENHEMRIQREAFALLYRAIPEFQLQ